MNALAGDTVLAVSALCVSRSRREVLREVSLKLGAGEILAVLGPNGAGKSTLLESLGGLLSITSGSIARDGRIATAMQSADLARRTALANVELALAWWGVPRSERRARATDALAAMGAAHLADRSASSMSGGERRRVHLARAVALRPDVLLLDEPFAGLDHESRAALLDDTASALRTSARAVVIVVHDRAEAWALADRLIVMLDGRIAADGPPRALLDQPPTAEVARFLGFNGELRVGDGVRLTRAANVQVGEGGDVEATVTSIVPLEDGARAELRTADGSVWGNVPYPGTSVGDRVMLRIAGGASFPLAVMPGEGSGE